jgi:hypothetical protein
MSGCCCRGGAASLGSAPGTRSGRPVGRVPCLDFPQETPAVTRRPSYCRPIGPRPWTRKLGEEADLQGSQWKARSPPEAGVDQGAVQTIAKGRLRSFEAPPGRAPCANGGHTPVAHERGQSTHKRGQSTHKAALRPAFLQLTRPLSRRATLARMKSSSRAFSAKTLSEASGIMGVAVDMRRTSGASKFRV